MRYDAITIDTQTVEHHGFHFDGGMLAQLKQFKDGPLKVIVSDIVTSEILDHLTEKTRQAQDSFETARRKAGSFGLLNSKAGTLRDRELDPKAIAKSRLEDFLHSIGAARVSVDSVSTTEVVRRFFASAPPFSAGKKKNEFPDAIALLSLETWAKDRESKLLAVSGDADWAAFADKSEYIDVVARLDEALAMLQEHAKEAKRTVQRILVEIKHHKSSDLAQQLQTQLDLRVADLIVGAAADSAYIVEGDLAQLTLVSYELVGDDEEFALYVVQSKANTVAAQIALDLEVEAEATFSLSIYDSIDKEYLGVGSVNATTRQTLEVDVLATFEGDLQCGNVRLIGLELVDVPDTIDFGYVAPDFEDYDRYDNQEEPAV